MRLLTTGLLLASLFTLASPSEVEAQDGKRFWSWLERLSGPGPFEVDPSPKMLLEFDRLLCRSGEGEVSSAFSGGNIGDLTGDGVKPCGVFDTPKWFVSFNVSPLTNENTEDQPANWGTTSLTRSLFMVYVRPLKTPVVHLGAGAGMYYLNGSGSGDRADERYKSYQAAIPVRVRLTPFAFLAPSNRLLRNLSRSFYWEGGWDFLPGPIEADQFKSAAEYSVKNEWVLTHRFVLNLTTPDRLLTRVAAAARPTRLRRLSARGESMSKLSAGVQSSRHGPAADPRAF